MSTFLLILSSPIHVLIEGTNPFVRPALALAFLCLVLLAIKFLPQRLLLQARPIKIVAVSVIAFLFVAGLGLQLWLAALHGIPQERVTTFLVGDEITNTSVAHSHTGKTFLATLVEYVSPGAVSVADTGGAIATQVPHAVVLLFACLFAIGVILAILSSAIAVRESGRGRVAICALAVLAGYITLVRVADGGIFADNAILALSCFVGVLLFPKRGAIFALAVGFCASLVATLALHNFSFIETVRAYDALANTVVLLTVLLALGLLALGPAYKKLAVATAIAALVLLPLKAYIDTSERLSFLWTSVREARVGAYAHEATIDAEVVGRIGSFALYAMREITPAEIVDRYSLPYWYAPVAVYTEACAEGSHRTRMTFALHTATRPEVLQLGVEGLAGLSLTPRGLNAAGWETYDGELFMDSCVPRRWDVLRELLRAQGITTSLVHSAITRRESGWP